MKYLLSLVLTICLFVIDGESITTQPSCFTCCQSEQLGSSRQTTPEVGQLQGPRGKSGPSGMPGIKGEKGDVGPSGPLRPQAEQLHGPRGITGPRGQRGPRGTKGPRGPRGPSGPAGIKGEKGEAGEFNSDAEALASLATKYENLLNLTMKLDSQLNSKASTGSPTAVAPTTACSVSAAGIQDSTIIEDRQLTSSSYYPYRLQSTYVNAPRQARLHSKTGRGWLMSQPSRVGQWLQVDLENNRKIVGVATQGHRGHSCCYTKTFKLEYKMDRQQSFDSIRDDEGNIKIFHGNVAGDADSVVKNTFDEPITARYVRIFPLTWQASPYIRLELFLC